MCPGSQRASEPGQDGKTECSFLGLDTHSGPLFIKRRPGLDPWVGKNPLEEGAAPHPSLLAWRIPWPKKPGRLPSMGSQSQTRLALSPFLKRRWRVRTSVSP